MTDHMTVFESSVASVPKPPPRATSRLLIVLFGLMALELATLTLMLVVQRRMTTAYARSAAMSLQSDARETGFDDLAELAALVNDAPNNVYVTHDAQSERKRLMAASKEFHEMFEELRRRSTSESGENDHKVVAGLDAAAVWMRRMTDDGEATIAMFTAGDIVAASRRRASSDRQFALLRNDLNKLEQDQRAAQTRFALSQAKEAQALHTMQNGVAIVVALFLLAIAVFAHRMSKELMSARERDRYVEALTDMTDQLKRRKADLIRAQRIANVGSWQVNLQSGQVQGSIELFRLFRIADTQTLTIEGLKKRIHPDDLAAFESAIDRAALDGSFNVVHRAVLPDGSIRRFISNGELIHGLEGLPAIACVTQDVTERFEAEEAFRASDDRFRLAVQATRDVVWDWNLITNKGWVSQALQSEFGYPKWGESGISLWYDGIHPDDLGRVMAGIQATVAGDGHSWTDKYRLQAYNGPYRDVLDRGFIIRDTHGKAVRMIGAMTDLTDAKRAEADLRALNAKLTELVREEELILNSTTDGIVGLDVDGRVTFLNLAAERLLGWSFEEIDSRPIHDLAHRGPDGGPCDKATCPATRTRQNGIAVSDAAGSVWRKDGSTFPIEYSSTPIMSENGSQIGSVFTFRDTTERRAVERMKDEFISVVSHELRTPLTSVRGALGLLAGGLIDESPAKGQRMMEIAVANTDRLIRLINDILDLERIESGKVCPQRINCAPADLLSQAADLMKPIAGQSAVILDVIPSSLSKVWADPDRIVQTLTNLLSNAIKFSPPGATVSMSAEDKGSQVTFLVRDSGRGIPAEKLTTIFERFQQVDASDSREKGGTGLGLAICRSIVRQHGSEIRVESTLGRGSEFSFSLPLLREQAQTPHEPSSAFRILAWSDGSGDREFLQQTLERNHYEVQSVDSRAALFRATALFQPDLILLDSMPQVSGREELAELKNDPHTALIPVVISDGIRANEPQMPTCLAGQIDGPSDEKTLVETLERALHDSAHPPRILVVEDDDDLARVITESFERHGIRVFRARDGRAAIELVRKLMPDLLILDPVLPELDGFGVVAALRGGDRLQDLPVIVYSTAETSAQDKERLKLGATEFMTKSRVPPEDFERHVVRLVEAISSAKLDMRDVA